MADTERRHASDMARKRADLEALRTEIPPGMDIFALEIHSLEQERLEASYSQAIIEFDRQRLEHSRQLERVRRRLAGEEIIAPFDGVVAAVNTAMPNTIISPWMSMITLYDYNRYLLELTEPIGTLRYNDIIMICFARVLYFCGF